MSNVYVYIALMSTLNQAIFKRLYNLNVCDTILDGICKETAVVAENEDRQRSNETAFVMTNLNI